MQNYVNIAILDTSIMSFNLGDQIIMESSRAALKSITKDCFVVNMPTHSPLFHKYEFAVRKADGFRESLNEMQYKFVCGTNLLAKDMKKRKNMWNIHMLDSYFISDFILVGVGTDGTEKIKNNYTKRLYNKILSHDYIHSVRDEKTKQFLESMGFRAINTGCTTIWPLTLEHCKKIPVKKADEVVFTLTDYGRNINADKELLQIIDAFYQKIYFWPQGIFDMKYLCSISDNNFLEKINIISPSLDAYNSFLESHKCDYVGTRLHAGIKAIQKLKRAVIIGIDNRSKDMSKTYGFKYLPRTNLSELRNIINSEFITRINLDRQKIENFLKQFDCLNRC